MVKIFTPNGRCDRSEFLIYLIFITLLLFIIFITLMLLGFDNWSTRIIFKNIYYILNIYFLVVTFIKRLHDLDKSGWMVWLLFIPIINIYIFIICIFFKWTQWLNKYGPEVTDEEIEY